MAAHETFATRNDPVLVTLPDGCRLAARVYGPEGAPPVLLVAGGDGSMLQWRGLVPELCVDEAERELFAAAGCSDSLARDLRVAAFDARGVGWSSRSHGACATTGAAGADVLALAAALFGGRFHLVGHGLGAAAALQVALAGPRLVASLTLISGTAGGELMSPPGQAFFEARARLADALEARRSGAVKRRDTGADEQEAGADEQEAGADEQEAGADGQLAALVRREVELGFTPGFVAAHEQLVDHLAREALDDLVWELELERRGATGPRAARSRGEQFASHDATARLGEVAVPTLVICGAEDAVVSPGDSKELAGRIPGARLVALDAGHAVTVERALDVAASLRAHVLMHP